MKVICFTYFLYQFGCLFGSKNSDFAKDILKKSTSLRFPKGDMKKGALEGIAMSGAERRGVRRTGSKVTIRGPRKEASLHQENPRTCLDVPGQQFLINAFFERSFRKL